MFVQGYCAWCAISVLPGSGMYSLFYYFHCRVEEEIILDELSRWLAPILRDPEKARTEPAGKLIAGQMPLDLAQLFGKLNSEQVRKMNIATHQTTRNGPSPSSVSQNSFQVVWNYKYSWLVVWNIFLFSHILGIIIPIDFHIFQRGWNHQPDSNCTVTTLSLHTVWLTIQPSSLSGRRASSDTRMAGPSLRKSREFLENLDSGSTSANSGGEDMLLCNFPKLVPKLGFSGNANATLHLM